MNKTLIAVVAVLAASAQALAGGTLTPVGSGHQPIQIRDHSVRVVVINGFAMTEVTQTFYNPNDADLEAIYAFPVPRHASLSEMTIWTGERELHGEVVDKATARKLYEEERDSGKDAGLAERDGYQRFTFQVSRVPARAETRARFVYYQPLEFDTGVARYVYPQEDGGTDDAAAQFWTGNTKVDGAFTLDVEVRSACPIADVRLTGLGETADVQRSDERQFRARVEQLDATLDRDVVLYYRLVEDLPGRIDVVAYRPDAGKPGTFMMVVTPGVDLAPLDRGADYTFVLDVSGSMEAKLRTLADGVSRVLGEMKPDDRFRVIVFSTSARELIGWTTADERSVRAAVERVRGMRSEGSTNLYEGVQLALDDLDADRASAIVLVTDGVTNTGTVDPRAFHELLKQYDVRIFGFLMGNSANWPLMSLICESSGGFYAAVSNDDDIEGQILLAKSKVRHECLHDASLTISGVKTFDSNLGALGKVYRGQQLVVFGRYEGAGSAHVALKARLTGEDKAYGATFEFPAVDTDNPEIERLWAMSRIEAVERAQMLGTMPQGEGEQAIANLGVAYQIVTDQTSMVVMADESFEARGLDRRNRERTASEHAAQTVRSSQPVKSYQVDTAQPAFPSKAPSTGGGGGGGGGALDPIGAALALGLMIAAARARRGRA